MLTWFAHVLPNYKDVVRLYDFFLCSPPMMPVYVSTAVILFKANAIMNMECDMASVFSVLSNLRQDMPIENLLGRAQKLYDEHPPKTLLKAVKDWEAKLASQNEEHRRSVKKKGKAESDKKLFEDWPVIAKVVIVAAPIVIGYAVYRWYSSN